MKEFIKHFLCFHFWKEVKRERIGTTKCCEALELGIDYYDVYSVCEQCIKCGKEKISKRVELVE